MARDKAEQDSEYSEAVSRAKARTWSPERILGELTSIDLLDLYYGTKFKEYCRSVRDELVPTLIRFLEDPDPLTRLYSGIILLFLDEPVGTDGIISCLPGQEPEITKTVLFHLSCLPLNPLTESSPSWEEPPVPLQREKVFAAISPFLTDLETRPGWFAMETAMKLDLPEANTFLRTLLAHPNREVRTQVVWWLARRKEDLGALNAAEGLLFSTRHDSSEDYWVIAALLAYAKSKVPELVKPASDLLARYIRRHRSTPGIHTTNLLDMALDGIKQAARPDEEILLELLVRSAIRDWRQGVALRRLAELQGPQMLVRLRNALKKDHLRRSAAIGIASAGKGQAAKWVLESLVKAAKAESAPDVIDEIITAILAISPDPGPVLKKLYKRLGGHNAMRIYWSINKITPNQAFSKLTALGIIDSPDKNTLNEIEFEWQQNRQPYQSILSIFWSQNRLVGFDTEASLVPPDYVELIERLAAIADEKLTIENLSQEYEGAKPILEVLYTLEKTVYRFEPRDFGDYFDVERVLKSLNGALIDRGHPHRYIPLHTGDQMCVVVFAPERAFREFAAEFRLPLAA